MNVKMVLAIFRVQYKLSSPDSTYGIMLIILLHPLVPNFLKKNLYSEALTMEVKGAYRFMLQYSLR